MNRNTVVLVTIVAVGFTAVVLSKKVTEQVNFNAAKRETAVAWDADAKRVLSRFNDSTASGTDRHEYRKMQHAFYDIVSNYNK